MSICYLYLNYCNLKNKNSRSVRDKFVKLQNITFKSMMISNCKDTIESFNIENDNSFNMYNLGLRALKLESFIKDSTGSLMFQDQHLHNFFQLCERMENSVKPSVDTESINKLKVCTLSVYCQLNFYPRTIKIVLWICLRCIVQWELQIVLMLCIVAFKTISVLLSFISLLFLENLKNMNINLYIENLPLMILYLLVASDKASWLCLWYTKQWPGAMCLIQRYLINEKPSPSHN